MNTTTRRREYREGSIGRRRTYKCRICGIPFQVELNGSWSEEDRVCPICRKETSVYIFTDGNGKEYSIRAKNLDEAVQKANNRRPYLQLLRIA